MNFVEAGQFMNENARQRFARLARLPNEQIPLAETALWIAAEAYPALDVSFYLQRFNCLAQAAHDQHLSEMEDEERVEYLCHFLGIQEGFQGNQNNYYDPKNSFLNEVLERRIGIPISLAVVYMEVARRLGWNLQGVSFPCHFLVKFCGQKEIIIDPFCASVLTEEDCQSRLRSAMGTDVSLTPRHLRIASPKEILARMLTNLKHIYLKEQQWCSALSCCERALMLVPEAIFELRDRGMLYYQLECFHEAQRDLDRFLRLAPPESETEPVVEALQEIRYHVQRIN